MIGEKSAFPGSMAMPHVPGMTYREWLIGQALAGAVGTVIQAAAAAVAPPMAISDTISDICIGIADAIIAKLLLEARS